MPKPLAFFIILFWPLATWGQNKKVVGYFPEYRFDLVQSVQFCEVTHLNLSFANIDSNADLYINDFSEVTRLARQENPGIKILISLGGGGVSDTENANWEKFIDIAQNRSVLISKILSFVNQHQLNGVDFDLEWNTVTSGYSAFVIALADSLKAHNKLFTAALPGTYRYPEISNEALGVFDFINIMAYSETGSWAPDKPGQHSSFDFALRSINFWLNQSVPSQKLILGVPFYGVDFNDQNHVFAFAYAKMVQTNPLFADIDQVGQAFYNGRPTIRNKVKLAAEKTAGIMIWELGQDSFDEYSLLSAIHTEFTQLGYITTGLCGNTTFASDNSKNNVLIYPNPTHSILFIEGMGNSGELVLFNITGTKINIFPQKGFNKIQLDLSGLKSGIYILRIKNKEKTFIEKIVVK